MKTKLKQILFGILGIFVFVIIVTVIEIFTGSNALYKWDVVVSPNVRDYKTGTELVNFNLMYSMFDFNEYREVRIKNDNYIIPMEYCRGEGLISSLFNGKATPKPGMYSFKIIVPGYAPKVIQGKKLKVKYLEQEDEYKLLLPEINMTNLNS